MRIVCLSDTHNLHERIQVPEGDLLLHAGDATNRGTEKEVAAFTARGKPVRFFPAEMHHATSRRWSRRSGVVIADYAGAAERAWASQGVP